MSSAADSGAPQRLGRRPVLDGLRGLAVILVIAIHTGLLQSGYVGVDIFFALSGFLITTLLYEESERTGEIHLRGFYTRRVRRLLPALLLLITGFVAVSALVDPFGGSWPLGRAIASTLLFSNNWVTTLVPAHGQVLGGLVPTWTLAEEVQFYLLWPLLLWFLLRRGSRPATVLRVLSLGILGLLAVAVLMRHLYPAYNPYTSPFDRGAELLLGGAAAILWRERLVPGPLRHPVSGWLAAAGLAYVLFAGTTVHRWWYLSAALFAALLIVNLLGVDTRAAPATTPGPGAYARSLLNAVLSFRPLRYVGRISYGIYLYHLPIYYLFWTHVPGRSPYFYGPIVLTLSLIAASLSWKLVESPMLRRSALLPTRWLRSRVRPATAALAKLRAAEPPPRTAADTGP